MKKNSGKHKNSAFRNVMVSIGCAVFAGAYAFGGGYVLNQFADNGGRDAVTAWLGREPVSEAEAVGQELPDMASETETAVPEAVGRELPDMAPEAETAMPESAGQELQETEADTPSGGDGRKTSGIREDGSLPESQAESKEDGTGAASGAREADEAALKPPVEVSHVQAVRQTDVSAVIVADVTAVVKAAMPCVVSITNEYTAYDYWYDEELDEEINGSGIIISQNGGELLIVTNYHVVEDNENLYVQFIDEAEAAAYVKGTAPDSDLAVISVFLEDMKEDTLARIAIAALGDSDSLQVGEPAIAIGNSLGYGQSVTTGVISALNREVFADDPDVSQGYLIQTDAAINPGNSGGALLNANGEVVGINSSKIADYVIEGMGYAIPISTAKPVIDGLMAHETRRRVPEDERAFLGISGTDVTEEDGRRYEMPEGAFVTEVLEDTAADKAGLLKGDIITRIDREQVTRMSELQGRLEYYAAGTQVGLTLMRLTDGEYRELTIQVTLGRK